MLADLILEARAEWAAGDGERDRDGDVPGLDAHLAHHVELGDRPLQLGIDDLSERLGDLLRGWAAPRFERSSGYSGGHDVREPFADLQRPGGGHRRACCGVKRPGVERSGVHEHDRQPELTQEKLGGGDVDRARLLERADRVNAARGEVAQRERE